MVTRCGVVCDVFITLWATCHGCFVMANHLLQHFSKWFRLGSISCSLSTGLLGYSYCTSSVSCGSCTKPGKGRNFKSNLKETWQPAVNNVIFCSKPGTTSVYVFVQHLLSHLCHTTRLVKPEWEVISFCFTARETLLPGNSAWWASRGLLKHVEQNKNISLSPRGSFCFGTYGFSLSHIWDISSLKLLKYCGGEWKYNVPLKLGKAV